MPITKFNKI